MAAKVPSSVLYKVDPMSKAAPIPIQQLFVVALVLKIGFSAIGWAINDPWIFGFALPLGVMMIYIIAGLRRKKLEVSAEKFADSCYYLGFIFTITSIVFSLFDLPHIGTRMTAIAIRFGAAMVSTVLGLGVRVYLVSFQSDLDDAVRSAEEKLIESFARLQDRANLTFEKIEAFETRVDAATAASVAKVQVGIEQMTHAYGEKLTAFFAALTESNHVAFQASLSEVRQSSLNLSKAVDSYSAAMHASLEKLETKVTQFADAVTTRLAQTTFPDDYFAARLEQPLQTLGSSALAIASQVGGAAGNIGQAAESLRAAFDTLQTKAGEIEGVLDRVATLAASQTALLEGSQAHVDNLAVLSNTLNAAQEGLDALSAQMSTQAGALMQNAAAAATQTATMGNINATLQSLGTALRTAIGTIEQQQQAVAATVSESGNQNARLGDVSQGLNDLSLSLRQITASIEENSHDLTNLVQQVADTNQSVQSARVRDDGLAQKLILGQQESASINQGVAHLSAQLAGLTHDLHAFVRETAELTQRLGSVKIKVQLEPADHRLLADAIGRGATLSAQGSNSALPAPPPAGRKATPL